MKANNAKKDSDKEYYRECMRLLFDQGENFENYHHIEYEYEEALKTRKEVVNKLYREIDIIKHLEKQ